MVSPFLNQQAMAEYTEGRCVELLRQGLAAPPACSRARSICAAPYNGLAFVNKRVGHRAAAEELRHVDDRRDQGDPAVFDAGGDRSRTSRPDLRPTCSSVPENSPFMRGGEWRLVSRSWAGKIEVVKLIDGIERTPRLADAGQYFRRSARSPWARRFPGGYRASGTLPRPCGWNLGNITPSAAAIHLKVSMKIGAAWARASASGGLQGDCRQNRPRRALNDGSGPSLRHTAWQRLAPVPGAPTRSPSTRGPPPDFARSCRHIWPGGPARRDGDCPGAAAGRRDGGQSAEGVRSSPGFLGLQTRPRAFAQYDTMIIGGGPAGLAAAVYGASEGAAHGCDRA